MWPLDSYIKNDFIDGPEIIYETNEILKSLNVLIREQNV